MEYIGEGSAPRLAKADSAAKHQLGGGTDEKRCGGCRFYAMVGGMCVLVEGSIEAGDICKLHRPAIERFEEPVDLYARAST